MHVAYIYLKVHLHKWQLQTHRGFTSSARSTLLSYFWPILTVAAPATQPMHLSQPQKHRLLTTSITPDGQWALMAAHQIGCRILSLSFKSALGTAALFCTKLLEALEQDMFDLWNDLKFPPWGYNCWVLKNSAGHIPTIQDFNSTRTLTQHEQAPYFWQFDFEPLHRP